MENILRVFKNKELGLQVRAMKNQDGSISINAEDTAIGFGWTTVAKSGNKTIRWNRINQYCNDLGFLQRIARYDYIPESLFYRLGMKANNIIANKFQDWLAIEVIPSIRKTGRYTVQPKTLSPLEQLRVQYQVLEEHQEQINEMFLKVNNLENIMTIDYAQQQELHTLANRSVIKVLGGKDTPAYKELSKKAFATIWRDFKRVMNVSSYRNTAVKEFERAIVCLKEWKPNRELHLMIKGANSQLILDVE